MTTEEALRTALEGLRTSGWDDCWCTTGDGNPHTRQCLDAKAAIALPPTPVIMEWRYRFGGNNSDWLESLEYPAWSAAEGAEVEHRDVGKWEP